MTARTETAAPLIAIVGAGPAGLMAAEAARAAGADVQLFDCMPSPGRKFLLAGRGGLNITHAEAPARFNARYGDAWPWLAPALTDFDSQALRAWVAALGISTFVGSSGRVFPREMKAAPLLRAWLQRLRRDGVQLHVRHRLRALQPVATAPSAWMLQFDSPTGQLQLPADAVVLALGGGSWPRLGSDGEWVNWLRAAGVDVAALRPANSGFEARWSELLRHRFAGAAVKNVSAWVERAALPRANEQAIRGEFVISEYGLEGSLVYALSAPLRDAIEVFGTAVLRVDLAPEYDLPRVTQLLSRPRGGSTLAKVLARGLGLDGAKRALLFEGCPNAGTLPPEQLAKCIKAVPLTLHAARPIAEAISSAGGVRASECNDAFMLRGLPGVFCAGEMLDWEAPTGGYLLNAAMATGRRAGSAAARWCMDPARSVSAAAASAAP